MLRRKRGGRLPRTIGFFLCNETFAYEADEDSATSRHKSHQGEAARTLNFFLMTGASRNQVLPQSPSMAMIETATSVHFVISRISLAISSTSF
jgi:hypothetical protein